jgi:hypothetical protein
VVVKGLFWPLRVSLSQKKVVALASSLASGRRERGAES